MLPKDSALGFGFRVFGLARTFGLIVVVVAPSWLGELSQVIGFGGLFTLTLLLESLCQPRTTHLMNVLESFEAMVVATVLAIGFLATGLRFARALRAGRWYRTIGVVTALVAVAVQKDPSTSLLQYEVGIYVILGLYTAPLLLVASHHMMRQFRA